MGDMGDYWNDLKPHFKEKRRNHVSNSITSAENFFKKRNIKYNLLIDTGQFQVELPNEVVDYWATTGTWIARKTKKRSRGFRSLMRYMEENK
ncbi:hypothetical protein [Vagococcus fluvialis]|uniref:hypothetical protein n=1 Tax=Vagococcus fluvialis TaxID=2738 RepID=UPI0037A7EADC